MKGLKPTNLSRNQIYELAEKFAEATSYTPGKTDIIEYVEVLASYANLHADKAGTVSLPFPSYVVERSE